MKKYYVMTLFPDMVLNNVRTSITGRAIADGKISVDAVNIREYTEDKRHGRVDDYPYGGGAGMLMQAQPIYDCYQAISGALGHNPRVLYMSPQGRTFDQRMAEELAREEELVFLCGHYEGVDERALELIHAENVSIGDYVLTGGELASCVMIDAISRLVPGVLNKDASYEIESFSDGLLEYPQYTRPEEYMGLKVPEILLSGDHKKVEEWRHSMSLERTRSVRPELYALYQQEHPEEFMEKPKRRRRKSHTDS